MHAAPVIDGPLTVDAEGVGLIPPVTQERDGAVLIPLGDLENRTTELPRDKRILVHCKSGGRSARAVSKLRDLGFDDVWNISGGIIAWAREIDPKMAEY